MNKKRFDFDSLSRLFSQNAQGYMIQAIGHDQQLLFLPIEIIPKKHTNKKYLYLYSQFIPFIGTTNYKCFRLL